MSPLNITQPLGIWSTMATIRWCPIFPTWDSYQPLNYQRVINQPMGIWDIYAVDLSCLDHRHVLRMRQLLALDPSVFGPTMTAGKSPKWWENHEKMMGKYGFIAGKSTIYNEENDGKTWDIHYEWRFIAGKILCRCVSGQLGVWYKLDAPGRWLTM